ncbi:DUF2236-containing protein [Aureococcus anophagefferens]|nr:DUF2236-containing protein [Aureococcus anophagefferens]
MDHIASRRIDAPVASWHSWDAFRDPPAEVQLGCGVAKYGQRFVWTKLHLTASQLAPLRLEGDAPMDAATAEVLFSTGYLASSPRLVMRRLLDTGLFLFDVCLDGPESLRPGGRGFECCLEVRALHASVRARLAARGWDAGAYGVPVNQEDMVVTLLAFSYNVLVGVEFLKGSRVSEEEEGDYLHLWRYLGHLLGVRDEHNPCASYAAAKATLESIVVHILEPDADSKKLARAMLAAPSGGDATGYAFLTRAELCRYMMRAVRRLHGHLCSGSKRHDVAATVSAPVATCP